MTSSILTLNAGSSSLKFALFDAATLAPTLRGEIADIDTEARLTARDHSGLAQDERRWAKQTPFETILHDLIGFSDAFADPGGLAAVGHRIVHGGPNHVTPARVTPRLIDELEALTLLDPLHLPRSLEPLRIIASSYPALAQVACFDTAFHHTLPTVARTVPLPAAFAGKTIRRYGFHGLSYEYIARDLAQTMPALARGRVIVAHLGSGASLCALRRGVSIATTMGFSVLDGLVMSTRCGTIDPGVILYLGRKGHSFAEIEDLLYRRSGLLGVSGISGDMRVLLASTTHEAKAAIDLFTYRAAGEIAGLACALGGIDGLVFTAGMGQHSPEVRAGICARLEWLGLGLDPVSNAASARRISPSDSRMEVCVIATDEEAMIAHHVQEIDGPKAQTPIAAHG